MSVPIDLLPGYTAPAVEVELLAIGTEDMQPAPRALRVDTAGVLVFLPAQNADTDTITMNVAAGEVLPIWTRRICAGTTATVHGLF